MSLSLVELTLISLQEVSFLGNIGYHTKVFFSMSTFGVCPLLVSIYNVA
jgi:uncharacterized membrane protein SpoIIM required for sporulation